MKRSNLIVGVSYLLSGLVLLLFALLSDTRLGSLLFGFSCACIFPGVIMIFKYFYWSSPKNEAVYLERMENETIEMHDERKQKLRDRAGRYCYLLGLVTASVSIVVFSILSALEIVDAKLLILYLGAYSIFQLITGFIIFRHLNKKY